MFRHVLAGGGGWGDPLERDPQAVLRDVRNEFVSVEAAREDYGVVSIRIDGRMTGATAEVVRRCGRSGRCREVVCWTSLLLRGMTWCWDRCTRAGGSRSRLAVIRRSSTAHPAPTVATTIPLRERASMRDDAW